MGKSEFSVHGLGRVESDCMGGVSPRHPPSVRVQRWRCGIVLIMPDELSRSGPQALWPTLIRLRC